MDRTKYKFYKLTPIRNVELKIYADALNYVFSDDDLKNIAITGAYSSGKSSILETYKVDNEDKKFIHISLAHFETTTNLITYSDDNLQTVTEINFVNIYSNHISKADEPKRKTTFLVD